MSDLVEQFMYTHPIQHHKKELLNLVRDVEREYLAEIAKVKQALLEEQRKAQGGITYGQYEKDRQDKEEREEKKRENFERSMSRGSVPFWDDDLEDES